jgi:hypothetical protein
MHCNLPYRISVKSPSLGPVRFYRAKLRHINRFGTKSSWHVTCRAWARRNRRFEQQKNYFMKRTISPKLAPAICLGLCLTSAAYANQITGSIGFGSLGVNTVGSTLATASSFTLNSPFITTETGVYTAAPVMTPITFSGFQFNPPVASVTPLWTFTVGTTTYSFDATTVTSKFDSQLDEWDIGGSGMAMVTGYSATAGTWNVNLSQSGASVVFDSSEATKPTVSTPDASATFMLLGGTLVGLAGVARKLNS